jgi:hypothetical protein
MKQLKKLLIVSTRAHYKKSALPEMEKEKLLRTRCHGNGFELLER